MDRYRGKWETGGSDLDAEAAPEEEAALDSDLNDQTFGTSLLTALDRFLLGTRRNEVHVNATMVTFARNTTRL